MNPDYQPSGTNRFINKSSSEAHEQGMILLLDTANDVLVKATDTTTNRKMGGLKIGYDQPTSGEQSLIDAGGCKAWLWYNIKAPDTGGTFTITGSSGTVDTLTCDGVSILPAPITYAVSVTSTAAAVAAAINAAGGRFYATSSAGVVTVRERVATLAGFTCVSTETTLSVADVNASGGIVPDTGLDGSSLYVADERTVTPVAGNAIIGTQDDALQEDGTTAQQGRAGFGVIDITGASGAITQISVGGTNLLLSSVSYTTSAENTAALVAAAINLNIGTSAYFAEARGSQVHIFQTTATLSHEVKTIVVTSTLTNTVLRNVSGGRKPKVLVKLREYAAALT